MSAFGSTCTYSLSREWSSNADILCRYVLYHSLLAVVRQCYRPSEDAEELEARRDLTAAMRALSAVAR